MPSSDDDAVARAYGQLLQAADERYRLVEAELARAKAIVGAGSDGVAVLERRLAAVTSLIDVLESAVRLLVGDAAPGRRAGR